jgi:hypothetical protein
MSITRHFHMMSLQDIRTTAQATVAALATAGFDCCLVGSAACSTYGLNRVPNVRFDLPGAVIPFQFAYPGCRHVGFDYFRCGDNQVSTRIHRS